MKKTKDSFNLNKYELKYLSKENVQASQIKEEEKQENISDKKQEQSVQSKAEVSYLTDFKKLRKSECKKPYSDMTFLSSRQQLKSEKVTDEGEYYYHFGKKKLVQKNKNKTLKEKQILSKQESLNQNLENISEKYSMDQSNPKTIEINKNNRNHLSISKSKSCFS